MPPAFSAAESVLQALGFALFHREASGALRAAASSPAWLQELWPDVRDEGKEVSGLEASPFLENFLIDAEECWRTGGGERAVSGPWVEQTPQGESVQLEATALTLSGHPLLLLQRLGEAYEAKKSLLQKARETVIAYQRLNSEIQKKEILLHCVAEDMTAALANVITSLRLLQLESTSPRSQLLLGLASRATEEQQALIHKVLAVFAEELSGLFGQDGVTQATAELHPAILRASEGMAAQFAEKKVRLVAPAATQPEPKIPMNPQHLERVLANLLENALERASAGSQVALNVENTDEAVLVQVEDSGKTMPPDACENLFSKLEATAAGLSAAVLRLHFCRMIVEGCGGEIGCGEGDGGGNRFWIRLPKIAS